MFGTIGRPCGRLWRGLVPEEVSQDSQDNVPSIQHPESSLFSITRLLLPYSFRSELFEVLVPGSRREFARQRYPASPASSACLLGDAVRLELFELLAPSIRVFKRWLYNSFRVARHFPTQFQVPSSIYLEALATPTLLDLSILQPTTLHCKVTQSHCLRQGIVATVAQVCLVCRFCSSRAWL